MEQRAEKKLLACGLVLAAWLWVLPAAADGLDADEDPPVSLDALSASGAWAHGVDIDVGSLTVNANINAAGVDIDVGSLTVNANINAAGVGGDVATGNATANIGSNN